jgi:hypothetical protein
MQPSKLLVAAALSIGVVFAAATPALAQSSPHPTSTSAQTVTSTDDAADRNQCDLRYGLLPLGCQ